MNLPLVVAGLNARITGTPEAEDISRSTPEAKLFLKPYKIEPTEKEQPKGDLTIVKEPSEESSIFGVLKDE